MTWFFKTAAFCVSVILLGFTLEVLGYTLHMCKRDCKDQPDDPVCSRWNFTAEDQARTKASAYKWLRNECERKCFQKGIYERADPMELCYRNGQNRTTYICAKHHRYPEDYQQCMTNASWHGN